MNLSRRTPVKNSGVFRDMDSVPDEGLMQAYIEGNESCFPILVRRYERELFSYLRRLMPDSSLTEDVFQNTFLQVHLKRHLYELGRPFRPWLYTIATNQAIDALRRNQRHQRPSLDCEHENKGNEPGGPLLELLAGDDPDPHGCAERRERRAQVRQAVNNLARHLRAVVVLCYYQGMKYKEIADTLGIPVGTVKSRLHTAIRRLGAAWEQAGIAEG
jgi:RNA polymerase sigma-70 factor (ECF subfamily)